MKIDRLYTLSQFIDILHINIFNSTEGDIKELKLNLLDEIVKYNNFLIQPLKKEMFVNEFGNKPKNNFNAGVSSEFLNDLEKWEEAEKKVIFKNVFVKPQSLGSREIRIRKLRIGYIKDGEFFSSYKTLNQLSIETNGTIELKQFEL